MSGAVGAVGSGYFCAHGVGRGTEAPPPRWGEAPKPRPLGAKGPRRQGAAYLLYFFFVDAKFFYILLHFTSTRAGTSKYAQHVT
jgi:hypothetical protein